MTALLISIIFAPLLWVGCIVSSRFLESYYAKIIVVVLSIEVICLQMVICTESKVAAVVVAILMQFVVVFSFLAKLYGDVSIGGLVSPLHEILNDPPVFRKIKDIDNVTAQKARTVFVILTAIFSIAAIVLRNVLLFPNIVDSNSLGFFIASVLLAETFLYLLYMNPTINAETAITIVFLFVAGLFGAVLVNAPVYCVYNIRDHGADESEYQVTESSEMLLPLDTCLSFDLAKQEVKADDFEEDKDYYVASTPDTSTLSLSSHDYLTYYSANSTNLQFVDEKDVDIVIKEDATPRIVKRQTWYKRRYSGAIQTEPAKYYIYLPSEDYVLN